MKKGVTKKAATKKALPKKSAVKKGAKNEKKQSGVMLRPKAEEYPQESTAFVSLEDSFIVVSDTSQTVVVPAKAWYYPKRTTGPRPGIDSFEYMLDYNGKQLSPVTVVVAGINKRYEGTIQADLGGISVKGDKPLLDSLTVTVITKKKVKPPPAPTPLSSSADELIYKADKLAAAKSKRGTKKSAK